MTNSCDTSCRVAICDDVADFRRVMALLLEYETSIDVVGQASNGREALELVQGTDVDVLLLDMAMPVMDGMEALPMIVEASPSTAVVMLTGFGSAAMRREAQQLGATAYIEKGTPPRDMVDTIRAACAAQPPR